MNRAHELLDFNNYKDLFNKYESLTKISFDYAVVEHESDIAVMRFSGQWKDLGTWNALVEAMTEPIMDKAILNDKCQNVSVVNKLNVLVLCIGLKDIIVCASAEGILVSDKEQSSYIKPFVDGQDQQIMFAEKSWVSYSVLDVLQGGITIKVTLIVGQSMNYNAHEYRNEVLKVLAGEGETIVDSMAQAVKPGDVITILAGCKHTIKANTELTMNEVQLGENITIHNKIKY